MLKTIPIGIMRPLIKTAMRMALRMFTTMMQALKTMVIIAVKATSMTSQFY